MSENYDVIVVGGGNAAMCAALAARGAGGRVLVLERSTEHMRGGNTRHTRNIRCSHAEADQFFSGPYSEEEHLQGLDRRDGRSGKYGSRQNGDPRIEQAARMDERARSALAATARGHAASGPDESLVSGGGKALLNTYYLTAKRMGIDVRYNAFVDDLLIENGRFEAVRLRNENGGELVRARSVVVACGGYEANVEWLKRHWGDAADNFIIRGITLQ